MRFVRSPVATLAVPALLVRANQLRAASDQQLAHDIYKELVEINTADSVGSTTVAANAVAKRFRDAGFPESDIFQGGPRPDKGNIVVRYHGNGQRGSRCFSSPTSTSSRRSRPTGRPTSIRSCSPSATATTTAAARATTRRWRRSSSPICSASSRRSYVPDRDIILALTADEEGGGSNGVRWLIANHKELIDAAYALNEGGGGALRDGKPFINSVGAAEKVSANFTVSTANRGGHSSVPRDDNAIYQLAEALTHIGKYQFPVMLNEVTKAFFTRPRRSRRRRWRRRCARSSRIRTTPRRRRRSRAIRATARCCARRAWRCITHAGAGVSAGSLARAIGGFVLRSAAVAGAGCDGAPGDAPLFFLIILLCA